jgi:predicted Zn-dependent peptidase
MALPALLLAAAVATWDVDPATAGALVEDHRAPVITITVEFPVGSWSSWAKETHATDGFEFADNDPGRVSKKRADALAAELSIDLGGRSSSLTIRCLKDDLAAAVGLAKDVLTNAEYDVHALKRAGRERSILWRGNKTDVSFLMARSMARELFAPADPRRLPYERFEKVATDPKKIAAARDVLVRLPGRIVAFAGDLTLAEAKRAADGLLPAAGEAPRGVAPTLSPISPPGSRASRRDIPIRNLTQVYLAYGRDSLPWNDGRRPAFLVADHVLGGHFYSRLYMALRHESGDTYGAGTTERGDVVPGSYAASTFTRADNAGAIEAKLTAAMSVFRERGITEEERAAAVAYLRGNRALSRQSAGQILARYLSERRLSLPAGFLDDQIEQAAKVPLSDINAFIREFYDPAQFSMLRAVPQ